MQQSPQSQQLQERELQQNLVSMIEKLKFEEVKWNKEQRDYLFFHALVLIGIVQTYKKEEIRAILPEVSQLIDDIFQYQQQLTQLDYCQVLLRDGIDSEFLFLNGFRLGKLCISYGIAIGNTHFKAEIDNDLTAFYERQQSINDALLVGCNNYTPVLRNHMQAAVQRRIKGMLLQRRINNIEYAKEEEGEEDEDEEDKIERIQLYNISNLQFISEGGFAQVFSGKYNEKDVAVKLLLNSGLTTNAVKEFNKEVQIYGKLKSSFVVSCFGFCPHSDNLFIVMELCHGGNLNTLLRNQRSLPWMKKLFMAMEIAEGLCYLHNNDVIHADLSSKNILLDNNHHCKITDFGLSLVKEESRSLSRSISQAMGTLNYLAPEIRQIRPQYSRKSDVYSYGVLLWELMTQLQFPDRGLFPHLMETLNVFPLEMPIHEYFRNLVYQCCHTDPKIRPTMKDIYDSSIVPQVFPLCTLQTELILPYENLTQLAEPHRIFLHEAKFTIKFGETEIHSEKSNTYLFSDLLIVTSPIEGETAKQKVLLLLWVQECSVFPLWENKEFHLNYRDLTYVFACVDNNSEAFVEKMKHITPRALE